MFAGNSVFLATGAINGTGGLRFPHVITNEGNDYNPSTGEYTCRILGTYWFSVALGKGQGTPEHVQCWILVNGDIKIWIAFGVNYTGNTSSVNTVSGSGGFHLYTGDRVHVGSCIGYIHDYSETHFSGVLVRPDA